jgi:hypothetical protein
VTVCQRRMDLEGLDSKEVKALHQRKIQEDPHIVADIPFQSIIRVSTITTHIRSASHHRSAFGSVNSSSRLAFTQ